MKKLFILFLMLCFTSPVLAEVKAPEWSEFCPPQYLNARYKNIWNPLCILRVIRNNYKNNNYWVNRKIEFANELNQCNESECYNQIRQKETNKNQVYFAYIQQMQNDRANRVRLYNAININNNLNRINNNINDLKY